MITGDSALTACHVAAEIDIVRRNVLVADLNEVGGIEKQVFYIFSLPCL